MKTVNTFIGHVVHCHDLDSGDEFNVEVLINSKLSTSEQEQQAEKAAEKNDLVTLSGNSFEFEYLRPSGRVIQKTTTVIREELQPLHPNAAKLLNKISMG